MEMREKQNQMGGSAMNWGREQQKASSLGSKDDTLDQEMLRSRCL